MTSSIYHGCTLNFAVADAPSRDSGVVRTLLLNSLRLGTVGGSPADQIRLVYEPAWDRQYNPEMILLLFRTLPGNTRFPSWLEASTARATTTISVARFFA